MSNIRVKAKNAYGNKIEFFVSDRGTLSVEDLDANVTTLPKIENMVEILLALRETHIKLNGVEKKHEE